MPRPYQEIVDDLFDRMEVAVPPTLYPVGVARLQGRIPNGTAFFPGGRGLYLKDRRPDEVVFPVHGVMVLGHNFDSESGFKQSLAHQGENLTKGTWRGILELLNQASIPLSACFFTNAFLGLCAGVDNQAYRGRGDTAFRAACGRFLRTQIAMQRPHIIVTLGVHVPTLLASASSELPAWEGRQMRRGADRKLTLKDLDAAPIVENVPFRLDDGTTHMAVVTAIAHPSDRRNSARRRPQGFPDARQGEIRLLRAAWEAVAGEAKLASPSC